MNTVRITANKTIIENNPRTEPMIYSTYKSGIPADIIAKARTTKNHGL